MNVVTMDNNVELDHLQGKTLRQMQPIAVDPLSMAALELARRAAKSKATILITGETGVGKEVLAHYIHQQSTYQNGPFVSVNCAALPENMIEAILFGYERGSFTGAVNGYIGKFEQAQNGTLLLDEVSEIPIALQAKLLRALQEREVERLGGKQTIKVNGRIIAATNRNLQQQVQSGQFRKDLYYRLNVLPLHCAAVRERPLDIIPLAEALLEKHAALADMNIPVLSVLAKKKLMEHKWPGNVREIENVMQRALIMADADSYLIDAHDIIFSEECDELSTQDLDINPVNIFSSTLEANEAKVIIDVLKGTEGSRNEAAKKLNISTRTLRYKLAKLKAIGFEIP